MTSKSGDDAASGGCGAGGRVAVKTVEDLLQWWGCGD